MTVKAGVKAKPLTIEEILAQAQNPTFARTATARVLLRQDLASHLDELNLELQQAMKDDTAAQARDSIEYSPKSPGLATQLQEFEESVEGQKVSFKFRSIGNRAWADLLAKHPPQPKHLALNPRIDCNPETFPITAIAASAIEPAMDVADAKVLDETLNNTQFNQIWVACLDANTGLEAPKSAAAGLILRVKRLSGKPAPDSESPEQSSLDEA